MNGYYCKCRYKSQEVDIKNRRALFIHKSYPWANIKKVNIKCVILEDVKVITRTKYVQARIVISTPAIIYIYIPKPLQDAESANRKERIFKTS